MQITADQIGLTIGLLFCGLVAMQAVIYLVTATRQLAWQRRAAGLRLEALTTELDTAIQRRQLAPETNHSWRGYRRFVVRSLLRESSQAKSLILVPEDRRPLPSFHPGQFLTLRFEIPGQAKPVQRCYSLSDRPRPDQYRCTIKSIAPTVPGANDGGLVSRYVNLSLQEGDVIDVKAPSGDFYLDLFDKRPAILLAGGIGITPLMSMIEATLHSGTPRQLILFYGVRHSREHVFRKRLAELTAANDHFRVVTCYSQPLPEDRMGRDFDLEGRVTIDLLKRLLPSSNYEFFLCGPNAFMDTMLADLRAWDVPQSRIRFERFGPSSNDLTTSHDGVALNKSEPNRLPVDGRADAGFSIRLDHSGQTLQWDDAAVSILECAENQGAQLPSSCGQGVCGTCVTRLLAGEVDYEHPPGFELGPGECLPCQARPKSDIVLDL